MERKLSKEWEVAMRGKDGEWDTTTLRSYEYTPEDMNIEDTMVREATPTIVKPTRRKREVRRDTRTLVAGDAQIPFQDETAMDNFQAAVLETQPDNIVLLGDMVDLPSMSRYAQRPEWVGTTQDAIDRYHEFLAQLRANAPNASITALEGNHDKRFNDYVQKNAAEVLGLKRAKASKELAVLSLRNLVRFDDLEVNAVEGYPNGVHYIEDNLKAVHGTNVAKGGANAAKYLATERESTVFGHTHRVELAYKTVNTRLGGVAIAAASPGALSMIDGSVPGHRHTLDSNGETVKHAEDWQQGLLVIDHNPRVHHIQPVRFTEEGYYLDGKHYK